MMEPQQNGSSRVMTVKEVSDYLRIPLSTIYDLTKRGKIKAVKFGKHWRYLESDIQRYFERGGVWA